MGRYRVPYLSVGWPVGNWCDYATDKSVPTATEHAAASVLQTYVRGRQRHAKRREVLRRAWMARQEQQRGAVAPMISEDTRKRLCTLLVMHTKRFVCMMNPYAHTVEHLYEDVAKITKRSGFKLLLQGRNMHHRRHKKLYRVGASAGGIYLVRIE